MRYLCPGCASGGGVPLPSGSFTGWVHSNPPHKTLFEPTCFSISLSPPHLQKKIFHFYGDKRISLSSARDICGAHQEQHAAIAPTSQHSPLPAQQRPTALPPPAASLLEMRVSCVCSGFFGLLGQGCVLMHLPSENEWNQFLPGTAAGCCQCSAHAGDRSSTAACGRWLSWKVKYRLCVFLINR